MVELHILILSYLQSKMVTKLNLECFSSHTINLLCVIFSLSLIFLKTFSLFCSCHSVDN